MSAFVEFSVLLRLEFSICSMLKSLRGQFLIPGQIMNTIINSIQNDHMNELFKIINRKLKVLN